MKRGFSLHNYCKIGVSECCTIRFFYKYPINLPLCNRLNHFCALYLLTGYLLQLHKINMVKLFIVGFPRDMEEIELVELFSAYGTVSTVRIITDKDSGISKGYGFLEMTDEAGAQRAIDAMNGATIDEREISVRIAEQKHQPQQRQQFAKAKPGFNKVKPQGYNKPRFPRESNRYEQPEAAAPVRAKRPRRQQP